MPSASDNFANAFDLAFKKETTASKFLEVPLFRAMMRAFTNLTPKYHLEEYHGNRRQVYFDTSVAWMRSRARCELCDVLFIVYSTVRGFSVRATLLQAKLSHAVHATSLPAFVAKIEPQTFQGNYEQWRLLSFRPPLIPTSSFHPPADLLSGATLPSIGSFGIFHKLAPNDIDLFYASADCLQPAVTPSGPNARYGRLSTRHGLSSRRTRQGLVETTYCSTARSFAKALYELEIGTPVIVQTQRGIVRSFAPISQWINSVLRTHLLVSPAMPAVGMLLDQLGKASSDAAFPLGPDGGKQPRVLILRSEHPAPERESGRFDVEPN